MLEEGEEAPEQPAEFVDFKLMERMHWSWEQLRRTPEYVKKYCVDFINMQDKHAAEQEEERNRKLHHPSL